MGDRVRVRLLAAASVCKCNLGRLSLLPSAKGKMSTSQWAVMLCGWGVKAGMVHPLVDKGVGGR